jgi:lipopolysaccharide/colanic/teichoic acid biosynthesis glycosyltransferase
MTLAFPEFSTKHSAEVVPTAAAVFSRPRSGGPYRRVFKRALDVTAVLAAVPVILPLIVGLAVCISVKGGSPFYAQDRVGKGRRIFRMWKLRSMVVDADARMEACLAADPEARREWDETQKLKNDPRITPIGRVLRKCSLDELPQLWNVLIGDMSLVGPRPMMTSQQPLYPATVYYEMRPGITGYWQVSARNESSFADRAVFDSAYDADLSLATDLRVLWRTVHTVTNGTGY